LLSFHSCKTPKHQFHFSFGIFGIDENLVIFEKFDDDDGNSL